MGHSFSNLQIWGYLAKYAYGIYLSHGAFIIVINRMFYYPLIVKSFREQKQEMEFFETRNHYLLYFSFLLVVVFLLSLVTSIYLQRYVEIPFLKFRKSYMKLKSIESKKND